MTTSWCRNKDNLGPDNSELEAPRDRAVGIHDIKESAKTSSANTCEGPSGQKENDNPSSSGSHLKANVPAQTSMLLQLEFEHLIEATTDPTRIHRIVHSLHTPKERWQDPGVVQ
jgi:hypothetical protein